MLCSEANTTQALFRFRPFSTVPVSPLSNFCCQFIFSLFFPFLPPQDGLVKANMEKLTFYALSAPEKLDRIGAYLSERLSRDVARHRYGSVWNLNITCIIQTLHERSTYSI